MSDRWNALEIEIEPDVEAGKLDALSALLFEAGAQGLETKDAETRTLPPIDLAQPLGPRGRKPTPGGDALAERIAADRGPTLVIASFPPDVAIDEIEEAAAGILEALAIEPRRLEVRVIQPVDWETESRRHFRSLDFGKVWVVPSWLEPPAGAEVVLRMDPGMAFGTGSHETTALCLERIVELSPRRKVLDVGTGTGVLAIAALLLGAERAVGTDNDPDALVVAAENAAKNQVKGFETSAELPDRLGETFDLVVANILSGTLIHLAPSIAKAVAPGGELVLSGILVDQAAAVAAAFEKEGLGPGNVTSRGEWVRIDHRRPA